MIDYKEDLGEPQVGSILEKLEVGSEKLMTMKLMLTLLTLILVQKRLLLRVMFKKINKPQFNLIDSWEYGKRTHFTQDIFEGIGD